MTDNVELVLSDTLACIGAPVASLGEHWGAIWVLDRVGRMYALTREPDRIREVAHLPTPSPRWSGALDIAVDPRDSAGDWMYVSHSYAAGGKTLTRLSRLTVRGPATGNYQVIIDSIPGRGNHNGGGLAVGADGTVFLSTGDAGDPNDAQDKHSLNGKILRIAADGRVPEDNPFGNLVWSLGFRNPQDVFIIPGMSKLLAIDHGLVFDKLTAVDRGSNHGWSQESLTNGCAISRRSLQQCPPRPPTARLLGPGLAPAALGYHPGSFSLRWPPSVLVASLSGSVVRFGIVGDSLLLDDGRQLRMPPLGRLRALVVLDDGSVLVGTSNTDGSPFVREPFEQDCIIELVPRAVAQPPAAPLRGHGLKPL